MQVLRTLRWSVLAMSVAAFCTFVFGLMVVLLAVLTLRDEPSSGVVFAVVGSAAVAAAISTYFALPPLRPAVQALPRGLLPAAVLGVVLVLMIILPPVLEFAFDPGILVRPSKS